MKKFHFSIVLSTGRIFFSAEMVSWKGIYGVAFESEYGNCNGVANIGI